MKRAPYLPISRTGKRDWLQNLVKVLPGLAGQHGVTPAEVDRARRDLQAVDAALAGQNALQTGAQTWTAFVKMLFDGTGAPRSGETVAFPAVPTVAGVPADAVEVDIFGGWADFIARLKRRPDYTEDLGRTLQAIGAEQAGADPAKLQPALDHEFQAGRPNLLWDRVEGTDSLRIEVDRGDGKGFVFLTIDTVPDYVDTFPLPARDTTALWKYRAIHRFRDAEVGNWSAVMEVAVKGA